MIVRFFNTGTSCGEAPINYLLGDQNHKGDKRAEQPEVLEGIPQLTVDLINGIKRKHKYASGCIAFRPEEQPTRQELHQIIDKFKSVVAPGFSADSINSLFVLHRDPPDKTTGLSSFHVHFILPMVQLDGANAGKRWNPHPPGKVTLEIMALFTSSTNHECGWKQVQKNPLNINVASFWRKVEGKTITKKAELLQQEIQVGVSAGEIKDREQLCGFITETLGMEITRKGADYLSVKFPGMGKAIRLKGPLFEADTNYERLLSANSQQSRSVKLTDLEHQTQIYRLSHLLQKRGQMLTGANFSKPNPTKENKYGEHATTRTNPTGNNYHSIGEPAPIRFGPKTSHSSHATGFVWGYGKYGTTQETSQTIPTSNTRTSERKNNVAKKPISQPGGRKPIWRGKTPTTADEINDQIRQLTIALQDASDFGQREIEDQICQLVGRRGNLPKPK